MTDRDHFAAAALTGLIASGKYSVESTPTLAWRMADAMLRERDESKPPEPCVWKDGVPVAWWNKKNHDAAPAARASAESVAPQPTASDRSGNPTSHSGTGKQPAPPCVETDGFSSGSSGGTINRSAERESPRRECGESSLRDVPQPDNGRAAGGPEHHISDRSQPVKGCVSDRSQPINDDRMADQELELKHGIQGNPMIKAQVNNHPVSYVKSDENRIFYDTKRDTTQPRNGALSGVPDPDSRVWETPCTPTPHPTPTQGSVHGEGSVSRNAKEPVAWLIEGVEYDTGCEYEYATIERGIAEAAAAAGCVVVPLYRHPQPTLTDAAGRFQHG